MIGSHLDNRTLTESYIVIGDIALIGLLCKIIRVPA